LHFGASNFKSKARKKNTQSTENKQSPSKNSISAVFDHNRTSCNLLHTFAPKQFLGHYNTAPEAPFSPIFLHQIIQSKAKNKKNY
jgi:hypothetical protein